MGLFSAELGTTEVSIQNIIPTAGTIKNFFVFIQAPPGGVASYTFTVRRQTLPAPSAATAVTCTITGAATSCSDPTHTAAFAAGDLIAISITPAGTPTTTSGQWTAVFAP